MYLCMYSYVHMYTYMYMYMYMYIYTYRKEHCESALWQGSAMCSCSTAETNNLLLLPTTLINIH